MNIKLIYKVVIVASLIVLLQSCKQPGGESAGSEYMPDMAHSIAYEANYYNYYYNNTWGSEDDYYQFAQPRLPVKGTVSRGSASNISVPSVVGSVPYYYENSEEGRTRAMNQLVNNPLPITDAGLAEGKELYNLYCGICHGDKGDGAGYLVRDDGGVYPAQPANFLLDEFVSATNGRYYHSIMHGRNLMGSYSDKLSHDERWEVIHYIRSLQAKDKGLAYNQNQNTLNLIDVPAGKVDTMVGMIDDEHHHDGHHEGDGAHGVHDTDHDDGTHHGEGHHEGDHQHEGHDHEGEGHDGHDPEGKGEDHKH